MDELPGALGTSASLALRLGQAIFAVASLLFMCLDVEFYSYTAFCFLVTIMGLVIPWSLTLAVVDGVSVFIKRPANQPGILSVIVVGDWVLSFLSLAASSSTASVTSLLLASEGFCSQKLCTRYQLSAAMAFLSCFLVTIMGLVIPWSLTLAVVDGDQPGILSVIVVRDWVLSFLSLAASSSMASVTNLLLASEGFCREKLCTRYQLSAAMAFLSWFLSLASSLFNLWLLPSA